MSCYSNLVFRKRGWSEAEAQLLLEYANSLEEAKLPVIFDAEHLTLHLGVVSEYVFGVCNTPKNFYRQFSIRKMSGGERRILEPLPTLKVVQRRILEKIIYPVKCSKAAFAYEPGKNIKKMMLIHKGNKFSVRLDIFKCFDNVTRSSVVNFFTRIGYFDHIARILAGLCCLEKGLPQGAPTSGALLNRLLIEFDNDMLEWCMGRGLRYTRYSDDIIVSCNEPISEKDIVSKVQEGLERNDQNLNKSKTRVMGKATVAQSCGVVHGNKYLTVSKSIRREFSKEMHYIRLNGIVFEANQRGVAPFALLNTMTGRLNWFKQIMGRRPQFEIWERELAEQRDTLSVMLGLLLV